MLIWGKKTYYPVYRSNGVDCYQCEICKGKGKFKKVRCDSCGASGALPKDRFVHQLEEIEQQKLMLSMEQERNKCISVVRISTGDYQSSFSELSLDTLREKACAFARKVACGDLKEYLLKRDYRTVMLFAKANDLTG